MRARINTTGTYVKDGILKVRIDLYPEPADKTYTRHYVDKLDRQPTEEELADPAKLVLVPTHKELNPCLCHFIEVPEGITGEQLLAYLEQLLTPDCLATLDDALVQPNALHLISPYMRGKPKMAATKVAALDKTALIEAVNTRLGGMVMTAPASGKPESIAPESIDIGDGATDRTGNNNSTYTYVDGNNPANASGTIDTYEVWFYTAATGVVVGTGYGSSTSYTGRDYESLGSVSSGSKQTFSGLSIDVQLGDFAMFYFATGDIESVNTGGTNCYFKSGNQFGLGTQTYSTSSRKAHSVYATGTESGGAEAKTASETGAGVESVAGRGLAGGEAGSGVESLGPRSLSVPDGGSGVEFLDSRSLSTPDGGSGVEGALAGAVLLTGDTGQAAEYAQILGLWEALFSGDDGRGSDSFKALTARAGSDIRLRTNQGQVGLPHKEVNR
jgi:hypothetical protein